MPVKIVLWFLQNRFIIIIPVWQDIKYWRKIAQVKFSTISLSYGVSIESAIQHSFFEMKVPTSWLYFLYVKRSNIPIVLRSDTQSACCDVAWDKLGKLFFVENVYAFKSSNFNVSCKNDNSTPVVF